MEKVKVLFSILVKYTSIGFKVFHYVLWHDIGADAALLVQKTNIYNKQQGRDTCMETKSAWLIRAM